MTKVVLLTRAFPSANALVRRLQAEDVLDLVICERAPPAARGRRALIRRIAGVGEGLLHASWKRAESAVERERCARNRVFGARADPLSTASTRIEYVQHKQWDDAFAILERRRPDLLCVFGTSLLPAALCQAAKIAALNLHSGLAPYYRGNNSVGFAILNDDIENIGATLHVVTPRIDGGAIVAQGRPEIGAGDDEISLDYKVHDLSHRLFIDVVRAVRRGASLAPRPQADGAGHLYLSSAFTRGHLDLVRRLVGDGAIGRYLARKASGRAQELPIVVLEGAGTPAIGPPI